MRTTCADALHSTTLAIRWGGATHSHGIWLEDCGGAAPRIVDTFLIASNGDTQQTAVDGVRTMGDGHPVIDSNLRISGGGEGQASSPNGVHGGASSSLVASQCVVLGNLLIRGSDFGFPPVATGVRCDGDGCMRIANNRITGRGGVTCYGIWLEQTTAMVDGKVVAGGCSATSIGIHAEDAASRLQNNRVAGSSPLDWSGTAVDLTTRIALEVVTAAGVNELDVHSNSFDGTGQRSPCSSSAVELGVGSAAPTTPVGLFRNNILRAGICNTASYGFRELVAAADPSAFENNDLWPSPAPTALSFDEATTALGTDADINAQVDTLVGSHLAADPPFVSYPTDLHLQAGSPCEGAGTATGAPSLDMDGDARAPASPDIGPDARSRPATTT